MSKPFLKVETLREGVVVWRLHEGSQRTWLRFDSLKGGLFWVHVRPDLATRKQHMQELAERGGGEDTVMAVRLRDDFSAADLAVLDRDPMA